MLVKGGGVTQSTESPVRNLYSGKWTAKSFFIKGVKKVMLIAITTLFISDTLYFRYLSLFCVIWIMASINWETGNA